MSLHEVFDEVASTVRASEPGHAADAAWASGARRRGRTRVGGVLGVLGVLLIAVTVGLSADGTSAPPAPPGSTGLAPGQGLPSRIYATKPWLDTIGGRPIPPMAYLYGATGWPKVVSVDGSYRFAPKPSSRSQLGLGSGAISPGGRYLAYVWGPSGRTPPPDSRSQVWVFDSVTGESRVLAEGSSQEAWVTGLSWSPDASQLVWQEAPSGDPTLPGTVFVASLSGGVKELRGFRGSVAWSPDGRRLLATRASGGAVITDLSGAVLVRLDVPTNTAFWPNSWSPDGTAVVGISCTTGQQPDGGVSDRQTNCLGDPLPVMQVANADTGTATTTSLGYANVQVTGWRGGKPLIGGPLDGASESGLLAFGVAPTDPTTGQRPDGQVVTTGDESLGFQVRFQAPQDLLETAPVVDFPPPDQSVLTFVSWAWDQYRIWILGGALLTIVLLAAPAARRRSRHRSQH